MKRRSRSIAGLFALAALTFSFAETVWASACAPGMDMGAAVSTTGEETASGAEAMSGMPGMPDSDGERGGPEGERDCPFGPASSTQGCAGTASLPAHGAEAPAAPSVGSVRSSVDEIQHDLLFGNALFHPPRA